MTEAFLCDAIRTPVGRYGGALSSVRPDDLAAWAIRALLERNPGVDASRIDDVIVFFGGVGGLPGGNLAGSATVFGRHVGYASYVTFDPFVILHETNHTIDSIFSHLGYEPYEYNHGLWAVPSVAGFDMIVNGEISDPGAPAMGAPLRLSLPRVRAGRVP